MSKKLHRCAKCKEKKAPLYKRGPVKVCADCLPPYDKDSRQRQYVRNRTHRDEFNDMAERMGLPRLDRG